MLRSKTTADLASSINRFKSQKKDFDQKIKSSLAENNKILQHQNTQQNQKILNLTLRKEKSVQAFQSKLLKLKKVEEYQDVKLNQLEIQNLNRKQQLQKRMEELSNRNAQRIQQIKQIEEKTLKKIHEDILKNENKQRHLRSQYKKIVGWKQSSPEMRKIQLEANEKHWREIESEKGKIRCGSNEYVKQQEELIKSRNRIIVKRQQQQEQGSVNIVKEKIKRKKNLSNLNAKEVGLQYLEEAKMIHREKVKKQTHKNMMNINLKVVDYNAEIMDKIARNTADLSKFNCKNPEINEGKVSVRVSKGINEREDFGLPEDAQTERYLSQIKTNLKKLNKDERKEQQILNH